MKKNVKRMVALVLLVAMSLSVAACSNGAAGEAIELDALVWAGSNQEVTPKRVFEEYAAANEGVSINATEQAIVTAYPSIAAARQTTPDDPLYNIVYTNIQSFTNGVNDDVWQTLDLENIPNAEYVYEDYQLGEDPLGVSLGMGEVVIFYNPEYISGDDIPTSWEDMWTNEKYKGHVVLFDNLFYSFLAPAAMANGWDWDAAFDVWEENADYIYSFASSVDELKNLFISGDAWICPYLVGLGMPWKDEGVPVEFAAPEEGVIALPFYLQVTYGTTPEEKAVCEDIINELLAPENLSEFINMTKNIPTSTAVTLSDELADNYFFSSECVSNAIQLDWEHMVANDAEWRERWASEIKSKLS